MSMFVLIIIKSECLDHVKYWFWHLVARCRKHYFTAFSLKRETFSHKSICNYWMSAISICSKQIVTFSDNSLYDLPILYKAFSNEKHHFNNYIFLRLNIRLLQTAKGLIQYCHWFTLQSMTTRKMCLLYFCRCNSQNFCEIILSRHQLIVAERLWLKGKVEYQLIPLAIHDV